MRERESGGDEEGSVGTDVESDVDDAAGHRGFYHSITFPACSINGFLF
jgi:membrane-bound metal-dependent hydrolase YbcI (DUF457 family)